ncbi:unnamed protein product [Rotaria magnacalcarata]|uniref:Uncharacterized protein n=1 Tax=Rotaria magnacalcarata TaxID=392030 RepID=A0A819EYZ7_9BILA|nr:unnamed protein product [Rotaria magnacalcarata]CAF2118047.1 unnamed protein product [Rotaria magnacalcarata]CAF3858752.1 unnamed protein product [Rotaria magnacalcarata]CAF4414626.1 unnamed protein product [Rotaria magnacalcarata]
MSNFIFVFLVFTFYNNIYVHGSRIKRFLDAKVDNRVDVLQRSHDAHREETNLTRNIFSGSTILYGIVLIILIAVTYYLYRKLKSFIHRQETSTLTTMAATGLSHIHPGAGVLMSALQRLDTMDNTPHQHGLYPPPRLPPLKF